MRLRDLPLLLGLLLLLPARAVQGASGGIVSGGGAGGSAYEAEASTYFTTAGITNRIAQYRLDGCIKALKSFGLWNVVEDVIPLSSIMQKTNGNNLASMRGRFSALFVTNGPLWGLRGLSFDGVDDHLLGFLRTPLTTFSVSMIVQGATNYATSDVPGIIGMLNSSYDQYHLIGSLAGSPDYAYLLTQGGGGANTANSLVVWDSPLCWGFVYQDPVRKYVTWAHDNDGSGDTVAWVNGMRTFFAGQHTTRTFSLGAGVLAAGARFDTGTPYGFAKCNMAAIAIFRSKLTDTQSSNLVQCMRWLDPTTKNIVILGDSMSRQYGPGGSHAVWEPWPSLMETHANISNEFAIFNHSINGMTAAGYDYAAHVERFKPGQGGVEETTAIIWLGYNDVFQGGLGETLYGSINSLANRCRTDGMKVGVIMHPIGARLMAPINVTESATNLLACHSKILTNREQFNFVVRLDNIFGSTNAGPVGVAGALNDGWNVDGLHPSPTGSVSVAQTISQIITGVRDSAQHWTWNQVMTNANAGATDLQQKFIPGNELRTRGDLLRFEAVGGFTNETTKAKRLVVIYGTETILDTQSRTAHQGPYKASINIRYYDRAVQFVDVVWTGASTNFAHNLTTTQDSSSPKRLYVQVTGADSGCVTNRTLTCWWEPLR